jgi:hypothetical protein
MLVGPGAVLATGHELANETLRSEIPHPFKTGTNQVCSLYHSSSISFIFENPSCGDGAANAISAAI